MTGPLRSISGLLSQPFKLLRHREEQLLRLPVELVLGHAAAPLGLLAIELCLVPHTVED